MQVSCLMYSIPAKWKILRGIELSKVRIIFEKGTGNITYTVKCKKSKLYLNSVVVYRVKLFKLNSRYFSEYLIL